MADQLEVQRQLTAAIQEQNDLLTQQLSLMQQQVNLTRQMVGDMTSAYGDMGDAATTAQEQADSLAGATGRAGASAAQLRSRMKGLGKETKLFGQSVQSMLSTGGGGALLGFFSALTRGSAGSVSALTDTVATIVDAITKGGKEVTLGALALTQEQHETMSKVAWEVKSAMIAGVEQPLQELKQIVGSEGDIIFTNMATGMIKVGKVFLQAKSYFLDPATRNFQQFFGTAQEGMKNFSNAVKESLSEMGPLFNEFGASLNDAIQNATIPLPIAFKKAFDASAEEMRTLAMISKAEGKSLDETLSEISVYARDMSEAFGDSDVQVGKAMISMASKVDIFHGLSTSDLAAAAQQVRDLGISAQDTGQMVNKFMNFDQTAEATSMLSQAFGANVDTMKLMRSNNPAEILDELRSAMFAAGQTSENMSVQQLNLLARTTGLSSEQAKLAFSFENQGKSSEEYTQKQMSMEEAAVSTAKAMEKLVEMMGKLIITPEQASGLTSYLDAMQTGMGDAVLGTDQMITGLLDMAESEQEVYKIGLQLGDTAAQTDLVTQATKQLTQYYGEWGSKDLAKGSLKKAADELVALQHTQQDIATQQEQINEATTQGQDTTQMQKEMEALVSKAAKSTDLISSLALEAGVAVVDGATEAAKGAVDVTKSIDKQATVSKKALEKTAEVVKNKVTPAMKDFLKRTEASTEALRDFFKEIPDKDVKFEEFMKKFSESVEALGEAVNDVNFLKQFEDMGTSVSAPLNEAAKTLERAVKATQEVSVSTKVEPGGKATATAKAGGTTFNLNIQLNADGRSLAEVVAPPLNNMGFTREKHGNPSTIV